MLALTPVLVACCIKISIDLLVLLLVTQFAAKPQQTGKLLPTTQSQITAKKALLNDAFWSGNFNVSQLSFPSAPGPAPHKTMCDTEVCFWFVTKHLYLSNLTYPPADAGLKDTTLNIISPIFTCNSSHLQPLVDSYLPTYAPKKSQAPFNSNGIFWARQFFWRLTGSYSNSSIVYPFSYDLPLVLPSGQASTIFGFCSNALIKNGNCAKHSITLIQ
ncbi:hypothetical protein DSO57_1011774 [Entomophthora muscae]|uniref:Uncharacterized protein n=1 Tax=Entomophthora muscae TaxID=34485 RepID=A0ACC2SVU2_9FUNG|nr:hypothetical protein DSO57_1011774 [Entomophthora muscae]